MKEKKDARMKWRMSDSFIFLTLLQPYEPNTGGQTFDKLLEVSRRLFKAVSDAGRNLSSMTTPVTIVGEENEIDVEKAAIDGFNVKKKWLMKKTEPNEN